MRWDKYVLYVWDELMNMMIGEIMNHLDRKQQETKSMENV